MKITLTKTVQEEIEADVFVVNYERLGANGWPELTPIEAWDGRHTRPDPKRLGGITFEEHERMVKLRRHGLSLAEIADILGRSQTSVDVRLKGIGPSYRDAAELAG